MITLPSYYRGKNVAVMGLGKTGISVVNALLRSGANVYAWDDNKSVDIAEINFAYPSTYNWQEIHLLVLSPGIPLYHPKPHIAVLMAHKAGCRITCDIDLLYEAEPQATFIGITGTNGKSTTASLIHHILQVNNINSALGGNIGVAALNLPTKKDVYVLEISSYQLDLCNKINFNISILLNITPDHINHHGSMENYINAKEKIFSVNSRAIIGIDNKINFNIYKKIKNVLCFSTKSILPIGISLIGHQVCIDGKQINKLEQHDNIINENIVAAYAACLCLKMKHEEISEAITTFKNLPHRMEFVCMTKNITFINDSKATNAEASQPALLRYNNLYWIAGGKAKEGGITKLNLQNVQKAFLIGAAAEEFSVQLNETEYVISYTLKEALSAAYQEARQRDVATTILLSPACSSFDQWQNFEERGNAFKKMVFNIIDI